MCNGCFARTPMHAMALRLYPWISLKVLTSVSVPFVIWLVSVIAALHVNQTLSSISQIWYYSLVPNQITVANLNVYIDYRRFPCTFVYHTQHSPTLTHWFRDKMAAVSQTTHSNAFSWMKMLEFQLRFHWSLFLRVQLTIQKKSNIGSDNGLAPVRRQTIIWTIDC